MSRTQETVETPDVEETCFVARLCESDGSSSSLIDLKFSRSASSDSADSHKLVKRSSLRSRGSPPPNKRVSFSQSVTRRTEDYLTVELLKPAAAEPMMHPEFVALQKLKSGCQWYAPYYANQRHYYDYYAHTHHYQGYGAHSQHNYYGSKQQTNNKRNPSAMLSAWINRDNF